MDQRKEFVMLAEREGANVRELCRRQQISPTTAYKWLARSAAQGLADQSRRPKHSPLRSSEAVTAQIVAARQAHPKWGARKLRRWLEEQHGLSGLPSVSTVHAILLRHGLVREVASLAHHPWQRFEHAQPNDLWQMDFKGHFPAGAQRCHPLTVLDDHSRYVVCLQALGEERMAPTQQRLIATFRRYGLPWRMTMDNGNPWGAPGGYTRFELWLMRLGIRVSHSRPYHPQTQGKDERFHRTLNVEVLQDQSFRDLHHAQQAFDRWLPIYNQERPHEALDLSTPMSRYSPSTRSYPEHLPALEYDAHDLVRKVQGKGEFHYRGHPYVLGQAFRGEAIALRRASCDETMQVYFGTHHIATITPKQKSITIERARPKA